MNIVIFYFSGTGNSKYIAQLFSENLNCQCVNIENDTGFSEIINNSDAISFCYPIYGSRPPRIMRDFVIKYKNCLSGKKLIIFCTQMLFSGDGARSLTDSIKDIKYDVIYAEHFNMPNNINNFFLFPIYSDKKNEKCYVKARQKMDRVCADIKKEIIVKRGFNIFSRLLGLTQGVFVPFIENMGKDGVFINNSCNGCGLCVGACPVDNLKLSEGKAAALGNCMMCYRCTNLCPQMAIKTLSLSWPKKQYVFNGSNDELKKYI